MMLIGTRELVLRRADDVDLNSVLSYSHSTLLISVCFFMEFVSSALPSVFLIKSGVKIKS